MNGLCFREFFSLGPDFRLGAIDMRTPPWQRLLLALALSLVLHLALVFMPYHGTDSSASRAGLQTGYEITTPGGLNANLVSANNSASAPGKLAAAFIELPAKGSPPSNHRQVQPRPPTQRSPKTDLLQLPSPVYYTSDQLSKRPRPTAEPELDTEETAPVPAVGTIILKLWIDARGKVVAVDVEKTDLPELFSKAALTAFRNLEFVPGERDGQRVASIMRIEVTYGGGRKPSP